MKMSMVGDIDMRCFIILMAAVFLLIPARAFAQGFGGVPWGSTWSEIMDTEGSSSLEDCSPITPKIKNFTDIFTEPPYYTVTCSMKFVVTNDIQVLFVFEKVLDKYYLIGGRFTLIALTREFALMFLEERITKSIGIPGKVFYSDAGMMGVWAKNKVISYLSNLPVKIEEEEVKLSALIVLFFTDKYLAVEYQEYSRLFD